MYSLHPALATANGIRRMSEKIKELEAENAMLRQQRDAANAQLDFLIEEMKKAPHGALVNWTSVSSQN